jgi:DNA-binding response OmpR family regulator
MKILMADDDAVTRRLLQSYLQKWGHDVVMAGDGAEAWQIFQSGQFPLVITDWMMPGLSGVDLIRRIRADVRFGYVYVILLTGRSQKEDLVEGMEAGADDFVTKPFDRDELRVRLREGERIIRLEQSLEEQNQALRSAQSALLERESLANLGQRAATMIENISRPIAVASDRLASLRREMLAAMSLLNKYRAANEVLARLEPELAAQTALLEQDMNLASFQDRMAHLFDEATAELKRANDLASSLKNTGIDPHQPEA